jgi:hypothetical protein
MEGRALCFVGQDKLGRFDHGWGIIWIADGVLAGDPKPRWTLSPAGMHEVLGPPLPFEPGREGRLDLLHARVARSPRMRRTSLMTDVLNVFDNA